jgi:hypothetical protein
MFEKQRKPISIYEKRLQERDAEEARLGLKSYEEKMRHRERKFMLGSGYRDRDSGTWRDAEAYLKKSTSKWDCFGHE